MSAVQETRHRSVVDAKAHFSECLRQAESGSAVILTRHGRAVAALVSIDLFEQLERLRSAGPDAGLYGLVGGWEGSEEVAEKALEGGRGSGRATPELD